MGCSMKGIGFLAEELESLRLLVIANEWICSYAERFKLLVDGWMKRKGEMKDGGEVDEI
jgi:hypothetical protein